jgi:diguanylate cyclase (GGDEF)-like protein/PAS domain S-box-containing protein
MTLKSSAMKNGKQAEMIKKNLIIADRPSSNSQAVARDLSAQDALLVKLAVRYITESKRTEKFLLETQAQLQHLLFSNPAVVYTRKTSGDYGMTFVSECVGLYFGYEACEFLEESNFWADHVHPADRMRVFFKFSHLVKGEYEICEYRLLHQDGTYRWIQDSFQLVENTAGNGLEILGCWQDITDRKQAEAELQKRDRLLQGVAEATNHLLTNTDYSRAIIKALTTLGIAAEVDRVYIYENHPHPITEQAALSLRFEWTQDQIEPTINKSHWQNQPYDTPGLNRWHKVLAAGKALIAIAQDAPAEERALLKQDGVQSLLLVPIQVDHQFWGFIGFNDCQVQRQWSKSEECILSTIAVSISGALKRHQVERQLSHQAFHDQLTRLPNRILFMERLEQSFKRAKRDPSCLFAVLFLDLDRFKVINDSLGHMVGDKLLIAIAQRLERCLRPADTVARLGGDEFTVLLENIKSISDVTATADRIKHELTQPFMLDGHEVFTGVSIGIVFSNEGYDQPENLLRDADMAMYRAKTLGRNRYEIFENTMHAHAMALMKLETDLRRSTERQEFQIYYQPIVSLKTGRISGFEALLRWHHPELGIVEPEKFISLAEETGMIVPMGQWVLEQACNQLRQWQCIPPRSRALKRFPVRVRTPSDLSRQQLTISVNLSGRQLTEPHLLKQIVQILKKSGIDGKSLKLEITESVLMTNNDIIALLSQLRDLHIQLHMDDFGSGYSSLSYLHYLPVNALKIDRSFVKRMATSDENLEIVRTIILLAHNLGIDVIAEGVETSDQLTQLRALNCEYAQGYLFSQPINGHEASQLLAKQPKY